MKLYRLSREQSRVSKMAPSGVTSTGWGLRFMYSIKQQALLIVKEKDADGIRTHEAVLGRQALAGDHPLSAWIPRHE